MDLLGRQASGVFRVCRRRGQTSIQNIYSITNIKIYIS